MPISKMTVSPTFYMRDPPPILAGFVVPVDGEEKVTCALKLVAKIVDSVLHSCRKPVACIKVYGLNHRRASQTHYSRNQFMYAYQMGRAHLKCAVLCYT